MAYSDQVVGAESGGSATATNPNSSATGAGQFINSTWLSLIRQNRPDLVQGKSDDEILAMRNDPSLSKEMVDAYGRDNNAILQKNGLPVTAANTYLAHFAGPQGAVSILQADPSKSAGEILGPAVLKANPFLAKMSAGDLQAWAAQKMGGAAPAPVTPVSPANGPVARPSLPMPTAPVFAQPQAQQQVLATPDQPFIPSAIEPIQIQYAQRRPINLAGLRSAAPIYPRGR